jgi:hypothetical protein
MYRYKRKMLYNNLRGQGVYESYPNIRYTYRTITFESGFAHEIYHVIYQLNTLFTLTVPDECYSINALN